MERVKTAKPLLTERVKTAKPLLTERVKRPCNAFMFYARLNRKQVFEKTKLGNAEISVVLGRQWYKLPDAERKKYFAMADAEKENHKAAHPDYVYRPVVKRPGKATRKRTATKNKCYDISYDKCYDISYDISYDYGEDSADDCVDLDFTSTQSTQSEQSEQIKQIEQITEPLSFDETWLRFAPPPHLCQQTSS